MQGEKFIQPIRRRRGQGEKRARDFASNFELLRIVDEQHPSPCFVFVFSLSGDGWLDVPYNLCSNRECGAAKVSMPVFSTSL
jgi:hypothetical protein